MQGGAQLRQADDLRRSLPAHLPAGRSRNWHEARRRHQHAARRPATRRPAGGARRRHGARGHGPRRPDEAVHAPDLAGRAGRRQRRDRAGAARRQLDDPRRRRAVPAGRHSGRRRDHRQHRRHVRRSARHLAEGARRGRPRHRCRRARREDADRDGLPGLVAGDFRQGHGQGDARRRSTCPVVCAGAPVRPAT